VQQNGLTSIVERVYLQFQVLSILFAVFGSMIASSSLRDFLLELGLEGRKIFDDVFQAYQNNPTDLLLVKLAEKYDAVNSLVAVVEKKYWKPTSVNPQFKPHQDPLDSYQPIILSRELLDFDIADDEWGNPEEDIPDSKVDQVLASTSSVDKDMAVCEQPMDISSSIAEPIIIKKQVYSSNSMESLIEDNGHEGHDTSLEVHGDVSPAVLHNKIINVDDGDQVTLSPNNEAIIRHDKLPSTSNAACLQDLAYDDRGMPHAYHCVALQEQSDSKCAPDADGNIDQNFSKIERHTSLMESENFPEVKEVNYSLSFCLGRK